MIGPLVLWKLPELPGGVTPAAGCGSGRNAWGPHHYPPPGVERGSRCCRGRQHPSPGRPRQVQRERILERVDADTSQTIRWNRFRCPCMGALTVAALRHVGLMVVGSRRPVMAVRTVGDDEVELVRSARSAFDGTVYLVPVLEQNRSIPLGPPTPWAGRRVRRGRLSVEDDLPVGQ